MSILSATFHTLCDIGGFAFFVLTANTIISDCYGAWKMRRES